jgi:hypothetical protein
MNKLGIKPFVYFFAEEIYIYIYHIGARIKLIPHTLSAISLLEITLPLFLRKYSSKENSLAVSSIVLPLRSTVLR